MNSANWNSTRLPTNAKATARSGQVIVIVAVMMVALVAGIGLIMDAGLVASGRRQARRAADAAAQAGAWMMAKGGTNATQTAIAVAAAYQYAGLNGIDTNLNVVVESPPAADSNSRYTGSNGCIYVQVTLPVNTTFLRLFSPWKTVNVRSSATAGATTAYLPTGLQVLNTNMSGALTLSGSVTVNLGGQAIMVNSKSPTGVNITGSAKLRGGEIEMESPEGSESETELENEGFDGKIETEKEVEVDRESDPLRNLKAPVLTNANKVTYGDGNTAQTSVDSAGTAASPKLTSIASGVKTLHPGIYWGGISISGNANVTFLPGRYVLAGGNGGLTIGGNANVTGSKVFIYNTDDPFHGGDDSGEIEIETNGKLSLSAPSTSDDSTYGGVLLFDDRSAGDSIDIEHENSNDSENGFIYAPKSAFTYSNKGTSNLGAIVDHITIKGSGTVNATSVSYTPGAASTSAFAQLLE